MKLTQSRFNTGNRLNHDLIFDPQKP